MDIKFHHCTVLQKGEAFIYYMYNRELNGYLIASMVVANNMKAKIHLASIIKYFFTEISRNKDVYCSLFEDGLEFFSEYITEHGELNGVKIYKIESYKDTL